MSASFRNPEPSFREALGFWIKFGFVSFGGPAGQIAILHRELVETKKWISEYHFLNGLNFCMLLPGPEAQQLATYIGWRLHGMWGGIAAGGLFVLPSAVILYALSWVYIVGDSLPWVGAVFHGLLGAVMAIVLDAVLRIGGKSLRTIPLAALAIASFIGIFFFNISFVFLVLGAGVIGFFGHRWLPEQFPAPSRHVERHAGHDTEHRRAGGVRASWGRALKILTVTLMLWWLPVVFLGFWLGWNSTPVQQGLFFSKAALVTFGGAYAVLPYVAQQAVENFQWLDHAQMMSGLALAESTPGPLIMVLQFVGFIGGWQHPGALEPWQGALIGSAITTWVTFIPCFLFIFLGAPWIEKIGDVPLLGAALAAITASVVGVILNLGISFARAALWSDPESLDGFVAVVAVAAFIALRMRKVSIPFLLLFCAAAGLLWNFLFPLLS